MANRRMISADLFEDDFIGSLDFFSRIAWIGLIVSCADDQGRFLDNPAIIRSKVFALDNDVKDKKVESTISELSAAGKILRYQSNNKKLIQIVNWWKYQSPSWASPSKFPAPDGWIDRAKYHRQDNKVESINWTMEGGFQKIDSELPIIEDNNNDTSVDSELHSEIPIAEDSKDDSQVDSELHSELHSEIHSQVDSAIDEMRGDEIRRDEKSVRGEDLSAPAKAPEAKPKNKESPKKPYGEFENVALTDQEYQKLQERFPDCFGDWIEKLSAWKESKGKKTKSDYATILNWERMDKAKNPEVKREDTGWKRAN